MFVDTGAWYAAYVVSDPDHARVKLLIDGAKSRLVTTDFVLAESLNLLRARNELQRTIVLGRDLLAHAAAELIHVTPTDLEQAFIVFSTLMHVTTGTMLIAIVPQCRKSQCTRNLRRAAS